MNSSVVPLSQGQVIMSVNAATATQAGNSTPTVVSATSTSSSSTVSSSAAVGLQRLAAAQTQSQQQNAFSRLSVKLRCLQCSRLFANKPELLDYKVHTAYIKLCSKTGEQEHLDIQCHVIHMRPKH